jgi:hypothetical protein
MRYQPFHRTLVVVNTKTKNIVLTHSEDNTSTAARITKPIYDLLMDGNHISYYAHRPDAIRVPTIINKRWYAKPPKKA